MFAGANTALLSKQSLFGCSILGCCCKEVVDDTGGSTFPAKPVAKPVTDNPFVTFTPVPTTSPEIAPVVSAKPVTTRRVSKYDTLRKARTSERRPRPAMRVYGAPDKALAPHVVNAELKDAFQKYLQWEESEFLALLLSVDEDCCYAICPD